MRAPIIILTSLLTFMLFSCENSVRTRMKAKTSISTQSDESESEELPNPLPSPSPEVSPDTSANAGSLDVRECQDWPVQSETSEFLEVKCEGDRKPYCLTVEDHSMAVPTHGRVYVNSVGSKLVTYETSDGNEIVHFQIQFCSEHIPSAKKDFKLTSEGSPSAAERKMSLEFPSMDGKKYIQDLTLNSQFEI